MVHPALDDSHWQKHVDPDGTTKYIRPMVAGEHILDQVHQLMNGHDQLAFGVTFTTTLPQGELQSRSLNALIRFRYHSPLIAARPQAGIHDPELRSWVYAPLASSEEAKSWALEHLYFKTGTTSPHSDPESYLCEIVSKPLAPGELFEAHLIGPDTDGQFTLFVYMSHAVLEGNSVIDLANTVFGWIADPGPEPELKWGEEWQNLTPGTVVALGGELEGWETESPALLEANAKVFAMQQPSHALRPQHESITKLGEIVRVSHQLDEQTTNRLIKTAKSENISITQLFEGAHVIATYLVEPPPEHEVADSHVRLWPSIISTRHLRKSPYNAPESVSNLNTVFAQTFPGILHVGLPTLREQVLAVARASRQNYQTFMGNPHHPLVLAAEAKLFPFRGPVGKDINECTGEVIGLGVIDKKIKIAWTSPSGVEVIRLGEVHLGLRQCTKRPMTHVWTLGNKLRLQVQASDVWDSVYLERFLDKLVECALSIC